MSPAVRFPLLVGGNGARMLTAGCPPRRHRAVHRLQPREVGARNDPGNLRSSRLEQQVAFVARRPANSSRRSELGALVQRMVVTDGAARHGRRVGPQFGVSGDDILIRGVHLRRLGDGIAELTPGSDGASGHVMGRPVAAARRRRPASALAPSRPPSPDRAVSAAGVQLQLAAGHGSERHQAKHALRAMGQRFLDGRRAGRTGRGAQPHRVLRPPHELRRRR